MKNINISDFEEIKKLDGDSLGDLSLVRNIKTEKLYVFRRLSKKILLPDVDLENEIAPFFKLNHKTVLKYVGSCPDDKDPENTIILATKYVNDMITLQQALENGTIDNLSSVSSPVSTFSLQFKNDNINSDSATLKAKVIFGIAEGMRYLHENQIIHGDLSPSNILIELPSMNPLISDFGLLKFSNSDKIQRNQLYKPKEDRFTYSSDIFAFGMIAYQILTGKAFPFGKNSQNLRERIDRGERPGLAPEFTPEICEWLTASWSPDPSKRPPFTNVVLLLLQNQLLLPKVYIPKYQSYVCSTISGEFAARTLMRVLFFQKSSNANFKIDLNSNDGTNNFSKNLLSSISSSSVAASEEENEAKPEAISTSSGLGSSNPNYFDPSNGIISRLTKESGGNVFKLGVVDISGNYTNEEMHRSLAGIVTPNWNNHYESADQENSWIQFFFYHRKVTINKYVIQTFDGKAGHLVEWKLEGSNDGGKSWTIIDERQSVTQLCSPNSKCLFKCKVVDSFNTIKLTQTGRNSNQTYILYLKNIEFYGTVN